MEVNVNLYGDVRKYGKKPAFALRVPAGLAVGDVLDYLKLPPDVPLAIVVNGVHEDRRYRLSDADVLSLFSMSAFSEGERA